MAQTALRVRPCPSLLFLPPLACIREFALLRPFADNRKFDTLLPHR